MMRRTLIIALAGCATAGPIDLPATDAPITLDAFVPHDARVIIDAAPVTKTLSETSSQAVIANHTISCTNLLETAENHVFRVFPLPMFDITGPFHLTNVDFGVEIVTGATQVSTVNVGTYAGPITTTTTDLNTAQMTTFASANMPMQTSDNPQSATVPITATIPADAALLVEIVTPSGLGASRAFVIGSNESAETLPSFTSSPDIDCNEPTPRSFAKLGHGEVHLVLTATGTYQP